MNLLLRNKDRAMEADKKLSDVIDAYGAFRATLGGEPKPPAIVFQQPG